MKTEVPGSDYTVADTKGGQPCHDRTWDAKIKATIVTEGLNRVALTNGFSKKLENQCHAVV